MMNKAVEHHRRSIRLKGYDYTSAGGYYVTLNTFQGEDLFGEILNGEMGLSALGEIAKECWEAIPAHFPNAEIDEYVVMPNHLHGIIFLFDNRRGTIYRAPTPQLERFGKPVAGSLPTIVRTYKAAVTRRAGRELNSAHIWQRNYYEQSIRDQKDHDRIAAYILANLAHWAEDRNHLSN